MSVTAMATPPQKRQWKQWILSLWGVIDYLLLWAYMNDVGLVQFEEPPQDATCYWLFQALAVGGVVIQFYGCLGIGHNSVLHRKWYNRAEILFDAVEVYLMWYIDKKMSLKEKNFPLMTLNVASTAVDGIMLKGPEALSELFHEDLDFAAMGVSDLFTEPVETPPAHMLLSSSAGSTTGGGVGTELHCTTRKGLILLIIGLVGALSTIAFLVPVAPPPALHKSPSNVSAAPVPSPQPPAPPAPPVPSPPSPAPPVPQGSLFGRFKFAGFMAATLAREACGHLHMGLVMPKSTEDRADLLEAMHAAVGDGKMSDSWPHNGIWLGGKWSESHDHWEWDDGTEASALPWATGQPSAKGRHQNRERWLVMLENGDVHDSDSVYSFGVMCEDYDFEASDLIAIKRFAVGTLGCKGNAECQFLTLSDAQAFCKLMTRCTAVLLHPFEDDCFGGFGCYTPRRGEPHSIPLWNRSGGQSWVKVVAAD